MHSEADLLARIESGEQAALRALYELHAPWLTLRLSRRCADHQLVDEAVQDTFVAVWKSADRFRGDGAVGAWLWGIGIRRLIDRIRSTPRPSATLTATDDPTGLSAEEEALMNVRYGDIGAALNRLSPELHAVIQACVLDGLTTREAATLLRIPQGTVKTRMMRARARLRDELT
jgi:RNA polymerase sigma-70 factor, ECF subfamily